MKTIINIILIITISLSLFLIHKDLEKQELISIEQQENINLLSKQLGYHEIRISSQMDTLMVHRSRLEQIKSFLESIGSSFAKNSASH